MAKIKYIVGIDEAGRGPLAGPLYFGAVLTSTRNPILRKRMKDSKKLSLEKRDVWFAFIEREKMLGKLSFVTVSISAKDIDNLGLSLTIKTAIEKALAKLKVNPKNTEVLLDGGLKAPEKFLFQKTIIKGDEKRSIIALASIVAKVSRDRQMIALSRKYPRYKFHIHKGYGTALHRRLISRHGPCPIHRKSFLKNIVIRKKKVKK